MSFVHKVKHVLNDSLTTFKLFEGIIAATCIAIPALLYLADVGYVGFRPSISNYVYMRHSNIFGMLLCIASMLFIFNGAVYFKHSDNFAMSKHGTWYNVVLGISLLGVITFPHLEYPIPHYTFAITFFFGNALVIGIFHKKKNRVLSITLGILTVFFFILNLIHVINLFWAEWFSLTVIGVHFIMESRGLIALNSNQPNASKYWDSV